MFATIKTKSNPVSLSLFFIIFIAIYVSTNLHWGKDHWKNILLSDAKGYYAYLPATFIYKDLNFTFFDKIEKEKYYDKNLYYNYKIGSKGGVINKYYCGTALAELPFFLIAHSYNPLTDNDSDGFSRNYILAINLAAIFYLFVGLFFINKLLIMYEVNPKNRAFALWVVTFGTNLFYYTVVESGMSHIYSFAFIAMFLNFVKMYFKTSLHKYVLLSALCLGIITLIRPINAMVILLLPFAAESWQLFTSGLANYFKSIKTIALSIMLFLAVISIQLIIYKIATGHFFVYAYGNEGFNFLEPNMWKILFSYKKGLFLYTPIYLVSLVGLYPLYKKNPYQAVNVFVFLTLITYVFSSWWMWFYGGSFSSRVYIEYLPLFIICFGIAIQNIKQRYLKRSFIIVSVILTLICQIQTYQYRYEQIHYTNMTKEKYWNEFLRIDKLIQ